MSDKSAPPVALTEPTLWLPESVIREALDRQRREVMEFQRLAAYVRPQTSLELKCGQLVALMKEGKDDAAPLAREIATEVYNDHLDRHFCEETGNVYFHACDHNNCW